MYILFEPLFNLLNILCYTDTQSVAYNVTSSCKCALLKDITFTCFLFFSCLSV